MTILHDDALDQLLVLRRQEALVESHVADRLCTFTPHHLIRPLSTNVMKRYRLNPDLLLNVLVVPAELVMYAAANTNIMGFAN